MYSIDYPKYVLASTLDSVNLQLSKHQLELIRKIQAKIQPTLDNSARPLFPEYRPLNRFTYLSDSQRLVEIRRSLAVLDWTT
jgi:hypothetical protein